MLKKLMDKTLEVVCQAVYDVGSTTATAISRIGAFEDDLEEKAFEILEEISKTRH
ncbi:MAG: hypothetical protein GX234_04840 [Clostridiales bacterium]|nr:hypothetical protein [Clostridiales bacterium]